MTTMKFTDIPGPATGREARIRRRAIVRGAVFFAAVLAAALSAGCAAEPATEPGAGDAAGGAEATAEERRSEACRAALRDRRTYCDRGAGSPAISRIDPSRADRSHRYECLDARLRVDRNCYPPKE